MAIRQFEDETSNFLIAGLSNHQIKNMFVEIITPDRKIFSEEGVTSVQLPGSEGSFGVLKNHAPLISTLKNGTVKLIDSKQVSQTFEIQGGVVEVLNNKIIVLAE